MTELSELFGDSVIDAYSRTQAIEDGVLVDAMQGDFAEVSRQHFKYPIAMSRAVFELMERAVNNPKWCNDYAGIWHDILHMSKCAAYKRTETTSWFQCIITGVGRKRYYNFKIVCGPGDTPKPVLTVMLAEED